MTDDGSPYDADRPTPTDALSAPDPFPTAPDLRLSASEAGRMPPPVVPESPDATPSVAPGSELPHLDMQPPTGSAVPGPMLAPDRMPGTNGLAVAALVLGILGFVPPLGAAAIVLGVMALRQASRRNQGGKGLAIAGIVLGSLAVVSWVVVLVFLARAAEPKENAAGQVTQETSVLVDDLTSGDCYNGGKKAQVDLVTVVPCSSPHESQLVTSFELPPGPYASSQAIIRAAERGCADKADPLVDTTRDDLVPTFIYPDPDSLDSDRTVLCTVEAISGTVTGSALK